MARVVQQNAHPTLKMTTTAQLKLRSVFLSSDSSETITNSLGDFFSGITSTISYSFYYLINAFNEKFPQEDRDKLIHRLFSGSTPYLIVGVVLITWLCFGSCLYSCISSIFSGCCNVVRSFFRCFCCCCGRRRRRMMKAPGRPWMSLERSAFEANPRDYFLDLRGQPNNFVY